ncbi:MAG: acyltransferase family protein [Beijerinckiaceae bacterium]
MSATLGIGHGGAITAPASSASTQALPSAARRNAGLDALRAVLTLLVLFHHSALTYGAIGGWYYHEVQPDGTPSAELLKVFCAVNQAYFMGLFFLIAGYLTPAAVARNGAWAYLTERTLRLGVPLLVFSLVIGPMAIALAASVTPASVAVVQSTQGQSFGVKLLFYFHLGVFNCGPLWFAAALLIFSVAFLALQGLASRVPAIGRSMAAPRAFPSNFALAAAALATGAAAFALRLNWPLDAQSFGAEFGYFSTSLGFFASYIVLFAAGCMGASAHWLNAVPDKQRRLWLIVALCALPVLPVASALKLHMPTLQGNLNGGWNIQAAVYAFWEPFVAWGLILALLQAFERRFASLGPIWSALARRAYAIYIIHPLVLVAIALAWRNVEAPHLVKFAITGTATCLACFWLAGLLLRAPWIRKVV